MVAGKKVCAWGRGRLPQNECSGAKVPVTGPKPSTEAGLWDLRPEESPGAPSVWPLEGATERPLHLPRGL